MNMNDKGLIEALEAARDEADVEGNISLGYLLELAIKRIEEI
jgi:hypothetical protein|tara:strand:+ start:2649 stop:2774 length:126 start_codon:yes stop_codon:yes gene_type:complete